MKNSRLGASLTFVSTHPDGTSNGSNSSSRNMEYGKTSLVWAAMSLAEGEAAEAMTEQELRPLTSLFSSRSPVKYCLALSVCAYI